MLMQSISIVPVVGSVADCCMATCTQSKVWLRLTSSSQRLRYVANHMHTSAQNYQPHEHVTADDISKQYPDLHVLSGMLVLYIH